MPRYTGNYSRKSISIQELAIFFWIMLKEVIRDFVKAMTALLLFSFELCWVDPARPWLAEIHVTVLLFSFELCGRRVWPSPCRFQGPSLAIFFWIMLHVVLFSSTIFSVMLSCYFLLNYACLCSARCWRGRQSTLLFSFELCKPARTRGWGRASTMLGALLFSFELCLTQELLLLVVDMRISCYFLLNYAGGWRVWIDPEQEIVTPCYFLLNYASNPKLSDFRKTFKRFLLFSFELCSSVDVYTIHCNPNICLLFSFELC